MGAMESKVINLRILVDKKRDRVVFAESDKDFVDILFSFLTLPLGTIVRLIRNQAPPSVLGCLNNLYKSLENLEVGLLQSEKHKAMLLRPSNSSEHLCRKLKFNIDDTEPTKYRCHHDSQDLYLIHENVIIEDDKSGGVFVNGKARFMISDDLKVMPLSTSTSVELLTKLGVKDVDVLEERIVKVGKVEVLSLLRLSLLSMKPLTDLFLLKNVDCSGASTSDSAGQFHSRYRIDKLRGCKRMTIKIMLRKSDGKVLSAEAQEDFIDYLLSLLAIPLGAAVKCLERSPSLGCITNLYTSVQELSADRHLKAEYIKAKLLSPMHVSQFGYKSQLLGTNENFIPNSKCLFGLLPSGDKVDLYGHQPFNPNPIGGKGFINGPATFVVTDDLSVTPLSPISNIFALNRLSVPISDLEERVVCIGGEEVLRLLEASLTSTSALTSAFNLYLDEAKMEK
ncbi:hypothetical protein IFM89_008389 [Coptis chinensis]|uniref:DUF674 family protein n=1 Tax=Coptis chinensis TaxID=261450 RepID=A0A835LIN4_9MAGN|nr:hypothetical protein IFM89_008389 [Coptis chinensis]